MDDLRKRLISDPNLRRICGFIKVPSLATFSRRMSLLSESSIMEKSFEAMVTASYAGRLVGDVSRDSTAIAARGKPFERTTEARVTHLYSFMDAAYDSDTIRSFIQERGRVPLIDHNKRKADTRPGFDPASQRRYTIRTTVERANSHLKDWFLSSPSFVKGIKKVSFQVLCGILCLTAIKILQFFIAPSLAKSA